MGVLKVKDSTGTWVAVGQPTPPENPLGPRSFPDAAAMDAWAAPDGAIAMVNGVPYRRAYGGTVWVPTFPLFDGVTFPTATHIVTGTRTLVHSHPIPPVPYHRQIVMTVNALISWIIVDPPNQYQLDVVFNPGAATRISRSLDGATNVTAPFRVTLDPGLTGTVEVWSTRTMGSVDAELVMGELFLQVYSGYQ